MSTSEMKREKKREKDKKSGYQRRSNGKIELQKSRTDLNERWYGEVTRFESFYAFFYEKTREKEREREEEEEEGKNRLVENKYSANGNWLASNYHLLSFESLFPRKTY